MKKASKERSEERKEIVEKIKYQNSSFDSKENLQIVLLAMIIHSYLIWKAIQKFSRNLEKIPNLEQLSNENFELKTINSNFQKQFSSNPKTNIFANSPLNHPSTFLNNSANYKNNYDSLTRLIGIKEIKKSETTRIKKRIEQPLPKKFITKSEIASKIPPLILIKKRLELISKTLEKLMEIYCHKLFDNLNISQLVRTRLGEVVNIVGGFNPPRENPECRIKSGEGIAWIKVSDLKKFSKYNEKFIFGGGKTLIQLF